MIAVLLFAGVVALSWSLSRRVEQPIQTDAWFDSDSGWLYWDVTVFQAVHRTRKHPLFTVAIFPEVKVLSLLGVSKLNAVRLVFAGLVGVWTLLLWRVLTLSLRRPGDALVFTLLGLSSSGLLFWSWVSETFLLASITVLGTMLAFHASGRWRWLAHLAAGFSALAVTVTNWAMTLVAAAMRLPLRAAVAVGVISFALVAGAAVAESRVVPTQGLFFNLEEQVQRETEYVGNKSGGSVLEKWRMFFVGSVVLPGVEPRVVHIYGADIAMLSAQQVPGDPWWWLIAGLWLVLLGAGILTTIGSLTPFRVYLLIAMAFNLLLHSFYGYETFLYSLHFLPILVILAAQAATRYRRSALSLAAVVALLCAIRNVHLLLAAMVTVQGAIATLPGGLGF